MPEGLTVSKPTPAEIGNAYDTSADLLDQVWGENLHHGYWVDASDDATLTEAGNRLTDRLADMLAIKPGSRLLDIGCGVGQPAIRLGTAHDVEVVGVSIAQGQVRRANERAAAAGLADRLSFQHGDAMDLPFPDESFDLVWALESLHHMPDRWHVISQAARILKPGGRMAIGDFLLREEEGTEADAASVDLVRMGVLKLVSIEDYQDKLREAGLVPDGAEDVSDHTRPSWGKAAELFEAAREVAEQHIGVEQLNLTISRFHQLSAAPMVGYVLLTAHKPA
jgi:cyclopropane fatty-acyl-phospholipid synthase-like methyltransferase